MKKLQQRHIVVQRYSRSNSEEGAEQPSASQPISILSKPTPEREFFLDSASVVGRQRESIVKVKEYLSEQYFNIQGWRRYGIQLVLRYDGHAPTQLGEILKVKENLLLRDVYWLIFEHGHPGAVVYQGLSELLGEHDLIDDFRDILVNSFMLSLKSYEANSGDKIPTYDSLMDLIKRM